MDKLLERHITKTDAGRIGNLNSSRISKEIKLVIKNLSTWLKDYTL